MLDVKKLLKKNPFVLAPMDDVTDIGFRELCEEKGACYSTTELTSINALVRGKVFKSRYEKGNLRINSVQLFGSEPDVFVEASKIVDKEADMIDVNFGCPSPNVTRQYAGSCLLKDPKNVGNIIEKLVKENEKPVTAKIRLGYKKATHIEIAKEIEDCGADALAVHGRTAAQKYSGKANWDAIQEIYEKTNITLIGNGDVKDEDDIAKYLNSHCDGLMIGRAAIGNPFLFERFNYYLKHKKKLEFDREKLKEKQKELLRDYLKKLENREFFNLNLKIQRQSMWFFKGIEGAKEFRNKIAQEKDIDKIYRAIEEF